MSFVNCLNLLCMFDALFWFSLIVWFVYLLLLKMLLLVCGFVYCDLLVVVFVGGFVGVFGVGVYVWVYACPVLVGELFLDCLFGCCYFTCLTLFDLGLMVCNFVQRVGDVWDEFALVGFVGFLIDWLMVQFGLGLLALFVAKRFGLLGCFVLIVCFVYLDGFLDYSLLVFCIC